MGGLSDRAANRLIRSAPIGHFESRTQENDAEYKYG
jgi:hypothetical protein